MAQNGTKWARRVFYWKIVKRTFRGVPCTVYMPLCILCIQHLSTGIICHLLPEASESRRRVRIWDICMQHLPAEVSLATALLSIHFRRWEKNWGGRALSSHRRGFPFCTNSNPNFPNGTTKTFSLWFVMDYKYSSCRKWNKTCVVASLKAVCVHQQCLRKESFLRNIYSLSTGCKPTPLQWMDMHAVPLPLLQFLHKLTQANLYLEANAT